MLEKELRELKRRFRADRTNIGKIVGCLVNGNKEIVSKIYQSIGMGEGVATDKLLSAMKKTLGGSLGVSLTEISFSTKDVLESEEHKLLMGLRDSRLTDENLLSRFYSKVIDSLNFDGNYAILLANDIYDVKSYSKNDEEGESYEQFSYIVCAVCPVKNMPEALSFKESEGVFNAFSPSGVLASPELGFTFPAFDDRKTNIYGALFYSRNLGINYPEFRRNVFAKEAPMAPKMQKESFSDCLPKALGEECTLEVVKAVQAGIEGIIEAQKELKDEEPPIVTKATVREILKDAGVSEEKLDSLDREIDECFGKNAELTPKNLISPKKFNVTLPEVSLKVSSDFKDVVSTRMINGEKYILIKVTGEVAINGITITDEE